MPTKTPTEEADAAWKQVFVEGPYTGFVMIDYLRSHANNITWTDILKSGYTNKKGLVALSVANKKEAIMKDAKLNTTWAGTTGRCTSFAVKVISQLEQKSPGTFKFNIYDIGRHRVARCEKTGILIDSSSKNGAFPLPEGEWVRIEGSDASWKWDKGKSKFERTAGSSGIKESRTIISKQEALAICLLELPEAPSVPTLFRSIDPNTNQATFHALLRWSWKTKSLEISPGVSGTEKIVIKFGGGTDETNVQCVTTLTDAIKDWGGPHAIKQWAAVQPVNARIWAGAMEAWGKPQCSKVD